MRQGGPLRTAAVLLGLLAAVPAGAFVRLEGEYFFLVDIRKQDRSFVWDFDSNNSDTFNLMQFRLFAQPLAGVEAFMKYEAEWNSGSNNNRRPVFQFRESHLRYRREFQGWGLDSYLFSRQDRFWVNNHLIRVVDGGASGDGGNAQGARVDWWGLGGTTATFITSDFSSQSNPGTGSLPNKPVPTDDAYIFRLRRDFLAGKLRTGLTWNQKNLAAGPALVSDDAAQVDSAGNVTGRVTLPDPILLSDKTTVYALDFRYSWNNTDYLLEYSVGRQAFLLSDATREFLGLPEDDGDGWDLSEFSLKHPQNWLPDDAVVRTEIRPLRVGNSRTGYFNVAPQAWYLGPLYRNALGDGNNDETGYFIDSWYLVPARAITWTNRYVSYVKRVNQQRHVTEFFSELYVEFVNGFTGKLFYRDRATRDWRTDRDITVKTVTENDDVFAEMQVENKLAWLRLQFRIRDLETLFQKELASIETSVNISNPLKFYGRFTFGNDPARSRKGLFGELQWRPRNNLEVFLAYGPFWIGAGSNPVFEGNLEGSADNQDLLRLIVKGTF